MRTLLLLAVVSLTGCCSARDDDEPPRAVPTPSPTPAGEAVSLAKIAGEATVAIATDGSYVYFTTRSSSPGGHGRVARVPVRGGAMQTLSQEGDPYALVLDSSNVYYTSYTEGAVRTVPKTGGTVKVLAQQPTGANGANGLALDANNVYWASIGGVWSVPKKGGTPARLAEDSEHADAIAVDNTSVYWIAPGHTGQKVGAVRKIPKAGGTITTLGTSTMFGKLEPWSLASDAKYLYLPDPDGGRIFRMSKENGDVYLLAANQVRPYAMTSDGSYLYWSVAAIASETDDDRDARAIMRIPLTGGRPTQVASAATTGVYAIAASQGKVYWTDYVSTGGVWSQR